MPNKKIRTVCPRDCYDSCHLIAEIIDGEDHPKLKGDPTNPITQGFTCPRGTKDLDRNFSSQRVQFPHIRNKKEQNKLGRKCKWDEALQLVSDRLRETLEDYGKEAVLHLEYAGNMGLLTQYFPQRIWNSLGATKTDNSICSKSGHDALTLHYGSSHGIQPENLTTQKLIVFWGFNAAVSSPHLWRLAQQARNQNQAKIVVIDPRVSETAKKADIHIQPYPRTDVAIAYGLANYLSEEGLTDSVFLEKWTVGFEQFREESKKWTITRLKELTGLKPVKIEQFARLYGTVHPSVILIGLGMQKSRNGAEAVRAISLLPALIGLHRAFFYSNGEAYPVNYQYLTGESLTSKSSKVVSQVQLGRHLAEGAFKFFYIYNMNPALTLPNQSVFRKGLLRDDVFVVVHETHWTETTRYADVVLPALTYLEKEDVVIPWSHHYVQKSNRVIQPDEANRSEIWVMQQLAQRLDLKDEWLFQPPWQAIKVAINKALTIPNLNKLLSGTQATLNSIPLDEYFTPSGKIEFASSTASKQGISPLPKQAILQEEPGQFLLLNSALRNYTHTQFQEIYGEIPPIVHIHPVDAKTLKIKDGDEIQIYNKQGAIQVHTNITDTVPPGILWSPRQFIGKKGKPQNCLTPDTPQPIGNGSVFNSTWVHLKKI